MNIKIIIVTMIFSIFCALPIKTEAGVSIDFDLRTFTSGGTAYSGSLLFIAHGADNNFNSGSGWLNGTSSFILGDDWLMGGFAINSSGIAQGRLTNVNIPTGSGSYSTTQFTVLYVKDITSSFLDYTTGGLMSGYTFGTGGGATSYNYGTWRTNTPENFGQEPDGTAIGYVIPANSSTTALNSYTSAAGGVDAPATFSIPSSFSIVPEPSTGALMMIGAVGLVALRRLRKV